MRSAGLLALLGACTSETKPEAPLVVTQAQVAAGDSASMAPGTNAADARPERGGVRGFVDVPVGVDFPRAWSLLVGPSQTLPRREQASIRKLDFDAGEQEFEVLDLAFADYDVRAVAPGWNGRAISLALEPGNATPYLMLQLSPAGFLDGRVLDHRGEPAAELRVQLHSAAGGAARELLTDLAGRYRFDGVLDGEHTLVLLGADDRVSAPRVLAFSAPSMRVPDWELPPLATLVVQVRDELGAPIQNARVEFVGPGGVVLEQLSDPTGAASLRHASAGRWKLRAQAGEFGAGSREALLRAGESTELVLPLRR